MAGLPAVLCYGYFSFWGEVCHSNFGGQYLEKSVVNGLVGCKVKIWKAPPQ